MPGRRGDQRRPRGHVGHSYITADGSLTYCIYEGPSAGAIRGAAGANGLPVDRVTEVRMLDTYFHH